MSPPVNKSGSATNSVISFVAAGQTVVCTSHASDVLKLQLSQEWQHKYLSSLVSVLYLFIYAGNRFHVYTGCCLVKDPGQLLLGWVFRPQNVRHSSKLPDQKISHPGGLALGGSRPYCLCFPTICGFLHPPFAKPGVQGKLRNILT